MVKETRLGQSAADLPTDAVLYGARKRVQRLTAYHGVGNSVPEIGSTPPARAEGEDIVCSNGKAVGGCRSTPGMREQRLILDNRKGVICHIAEPWEMPVDAQGVRADIIMGSEARTNRMNIGGLFEHYFNSASRQVCFDTRSTLGLIKDTKGAKEVIRYLHETEPEKFKKAWDHVLKYYRLVSPMQAHFYDGGLIGIEGIYDNLATIVTDFVYLFLPPEYAPDYMGIIPDVEAHVKPLYGPVTYTGYSGIPVMTIVPVRIGSMYVMLLEKTADDWSAVASAKVQHFGFLARIGKADKYSEPLRQQPIKGVGETEGRILAAYCGARMIAEIMDRNNNPTTHKEMVMQLLNAPNPTRIVNIVDREKFPYGKSKPIQMLRHLLNCVGADLAYAPERTDN